MNFLFVPRVFTRKLCVQAFQKFSVYSIVKARNFRTINRVFRATIRNMSTEAKEFERLPTDVLPKNYQLTLHPNLTEFTFAGKQVIEVEVRTSLLHLLIFKSCG